jgi:hypothetical protein
MERVLKRETAIIKYNIRDFKIEDAKLLEKLLTLMFYLQDATLEFPQSSFRKIKKAEAKVKATEIIYELENPSAEESGFLNAEAVIGDVADSVVGVLNPETVLPAKDVIKMMALFNRFTMPDSYEICYQKAFEVYRDRTGL